MSDSDEYDTIDAQRDLANRYDRMVQSQLDALADVDTNAWRAARLIGILIGVILTGLSITAQDGGDGFDFTLLVLFCFGVGILLLLLSLFYAALSILNVKVKFGPNTDLIDGVTEGDIQGVEYPAFVSKSLADCIETNQQVLSAKAGRLRLTYTFLLLGLSFFAVGVAFLLTSPNDMVAGGVLAMVVLSGVVMAYYILNKRYDVSANSLEDDE